MKNDKTSVNWSNVPRRSSERQLTDFFIKIVKIMILVRSWNDELAGGCSERVKCFRLIKTESCRPAFGSWLESSPAVSHRQKCKHSEWKSSPSSMTWRFVFVVSRGFVLPSVLLDEVRSESAGRGESRVSAGKTDAVTSC